MKKPTAILCLTITVLIKSMGMSWSADKKDIEFHKIEFKSGVNSEESLAISESLAETISDAFEPNHSTHPASR